ncbi:MAG TPA: hypothetical protein VN285_01580 [Candidatus Deferrimicrobium sp.]|nr:hypothetical protein [Candidatus Deferrimicrobium sp.]
MLVPTATAKSDKARWSWRALFNWCLRYVAPVVGIFVGFWAVYQTYYHVVRIPGQNYKLERFQDTARSTYLELRDVMQPLIQDALGIDDPFHTFLVHEVPVRLSSECAKLVRTFNDLGRLLDDFGYLSETDKWLDLQTAYLVTRVLIMDAVNNQTISDIDVNRHIEWYVDKVQYLCKDENADRLAWAYHLRGLIPFYQALQLDANSQGRQIRGKYTEAIRQFDKALFVYRDSKGDSRLWSPAFTMVGVILENEYLTFGEERYLSELKSRIESAERVFPEVTGSYDDYQPVLFRLVAAERCLIDYDFDGALRFLNDAKIWYELNLHRLKAPEKRGTQQFVYRVVKGLELYCWIRKLLTEPKLPVDTLAAKVNQWKDSIAEYRNPYTAGLFDLGMGLLSLRQSCEQGQTSLAAERLQFMRFYIERDSTRRFGLEPSYPRIALKSLCDIVIAIPEDPCNH